MKKFFGKKQIVLTSLLLALGLAVYLNYYFATLPSELPSHASSGGNMGDSRYVDNPSVASGGEEEDYFARARRNRQAAHDEAVDLILDVLGDVKADDAMKQQATAQMQALAAAREQEGQIESLICADGYPDCVAFLEDGGCYVVVRAETLTEAQALRISTVVTDRSGVPAQKINIVTIS